MSKINVVLKDKRPNQVGQKFKYSDWYYDSFNLKNEIKIVKSIQECGNNRHCNCVKNNLCHGNYVNSLCCCNEEKGSFIELIENKNIEILEDGNYVEN